ncbi:MAG: response regulator [Bacteroidales bacterium]
MKTILYVDNPQNLPSGLHKEFGMNGQTIFLLPTGKAAINEIDTIKPDLIICNITSPEISGIVLLFHLSLSATNIPCIALIGQSRFDNDYFIEMASVLKVKRILIKPLTIETLINTVVEVLG